jgi:predicted PurR-regulated permease PerM
VPYIGPVIAAALPVIVALAVDPGWAMLLWAMALFVVVELAIGAGYRALALRPQHRAFRHRDRKGSRTQDDG